MAEKSNPNSTLVIQLSPIENLGVVIFSGPLFLCSMEMVPGWSLTHIVFGVTWPPALCYYVTVVCGAIGGCLFATGYRVPGIIGGIFASVGGLFALSFVLERSTIAHTFVLVIVILIGSLPGMGLGYLLRFGQDLLFPPLDKKATFPDEDEKDRPRPHRSEEDEEVPPRPRSRDDEDRIRRRRPRDEGYRD
jgi:hypothetical protein